MRRKELWISRVGRSNLSRSLTGMSDHDERGNRGQTYRFENSTAFPSPSSTPLSKSSPSRSPRATSDHDQILQRESCLPFRKFHRFSKSQQNSFRSRVESRTAMSMSDYKHMKGSSQAYHPENSTDFPSLDNNPPRKPQSLIRYGMIRVCTGNRAG